MNAYFNLGQMDMSIYYSRKLLRKEKKYNLSEKAFLKTISDMISN